MNKEEKYLRNLYESVQYDSELFNIYIRSVYKELHADHETGC